MLPGRNDRRNLQSLSNQLAKKRASIQPVHVPSHRAPRICAQTAEQMWIEDSAEPSINPPAPKPISASGPGQSSQNLDHATAKPTSGSPPPRAGQSCQARQCHHALGGLRQQLQRTPLAQTAKDLRPLARRIPTQSGLEFTCLSSPQRSNLGCRSRFFHLLRLLHPRLLPHPSAGGWKSLQGRPR